MISESPYRVVNTSSADPKHQYLAGWVVRSPEGEITANVRTQRPREGAYTAWADGHVSIQSAAQLAVGTDFATSSWDEPAGRSSMGNMGCVVTDVAKYRWTLDGTLRDALGREQR